MLDMAQRGLGAYFIATALAAFTLLIVTPLFHDGSPDYPIWGILNYFMAVVAALLPALGCYRKWTLGKGGVEPSVVEYLRANIAFYGAIALAMLFFWEWFWALNPSSETGDAVTSHVIYFPIMDVLFVVMALSAGRYLWTCVRGSKK